MKTYLRSIGLCLLCYALCVQGSTAQITIRNFDPAGTQELWTIDRTVPLDSGFVSGTNLFEDRAKGELLRLPEGMSNVMITEVNVWFGYKSEEITNERYNIEFYTGDSISGPETLLYAELFAMADIEADSDPTTTEEATSHPLSTPIIIDSTLFVVVNFGSYGQTGWAHTAITASALVGERVATAWEMWADQTWNNMSDAWGLDNDGRHLWIEAVADLPGTAVETTSSIPSSIQLAQNYPNPFNPSTMISYALPEAAHVRLQVYDVQGTEIALLVDQWQEAGTHQVMFHALRLPSGIYIYRLETGGRLTTRKMILSR